MKRSVTFGGISAALLSVNGVQAQVIEVPLAPTVEERTIDIHGNDLSPYTSRAIGIVYDNGFSTAAGATANGTGIATNHILEDFDLTGGPMGAMAVKRITGIGFTTQSAGSAPVCVPPQTYDALLEVFEGASCDYTQPNMLSAGGIDATPIFSARVALSQNCNVQTLWTINLAPNGVGGANDNSFVLSSNQGFIRIRNVNTGTTHLRPYPGFDGGTLVQSFVFVTGLGANAVGTPTRNYGRDLNGDGSDLALPYAGGASGLLGGSPVITGAGAGAHEHRQPSSTLVQALRMKLDGDLTCTAPAATDAGNVANGTTVMNSSLAAGETKWFTLNIGAVNDASQTFLDLDTEGSDITDLTIALYDSQGARISVDTDEGSGLLPQLTYGLGRRGPVGDGRDYDGRDGQAAAGTYFVGVGGSATTFQSCFGVANTSTETGNFRLNITTNASVSGSVPPAPSVAPTPITDFGVVTAPGAQSADVAPGPLNVMWYKFTLAGGTGASTYLDLDTGYSGATTNDDVMALYDASGNLLATDDNDSLNSHAALSFGAPGSPRTGNGGDTLPFDGRDGNLAAGTYYVALALPPMTASASRWHVRTTSASNLGVLLTLTTNSDGSPGCGTADFDGDGDTGTDADIEAFFACLAGNCCATCFALGADFNADGDVGTDADIESFFRVLAGGPC